MPLFFQTPLEKTKIQSLALTVADGMLIFARVGPKNRLLLSAQPNIHPQGFGLYDEFTSDERSDTTPALGTLNGQAYIAWKGDGNDCLNFARVVLDGGRITGLTDKETFAEQGRGPLTLVPQVDRFLLGHTTIDGHFAYASIVPFDSTFTDPLPNDAPGCELCAITSEDEFYLVQNDSWNVTGRFSGRERLKLGDGWFSLLLTLKEGMLDTYNSGDPAEWQGILGEQVYWDELTDLEDESQTNGDSPFLHYLAISSPDDVASFAESLEAITKKNLKKRYDKLIKTPYASRLSDKDFEAAWEALQELLVFLNKVAEKQLWCVHRTLVPAEPLPPLPEVEPVKATVPTIPEAVALHPQGMGILAQAMNSFGVKPTAPTNEWPFNVLSQKAVRYGSGRIARDGDDPDHDYDSAELERCHLIAAETAVRLARLPIRSVDLGQFEPFCLPANRSGKAPEVPTPEFVRAAFRGTLHPWAKIEIKPAREFGVHSLEGGQISIYGHRATDVKVHNQIWNETADWFQHHPDLGNAWYIAVEGRGLHGVLAVRLIVGMTKAGSLAGVATVELGYGLTRTLPPEQLYPSLRQYELDEFRDWRDPETLRVKARAILRLFDTERISNWANEIQATVRKLKQKDRKDHWLSEFAKLTPVRTLTLSLVWETIQRCITDGRFFSYPEPEEKVFFSQWTALDAGTASRCAFTLHVDDAVLRTANWLAQHDSRWFSEQYDKLRATDYAGFMSDADKSAALDAYETVREFYQQAKDRFAVVVEITTRSDEQLYTYPEKQPAEKRKEPVSGECVTETELLAPLLECMESYGVEGDGEWPHNDLSPQIVRYTCGNIAREGEEIPHDHDPVELERCRRLAAEGERLLKAIEPPHDSGGPYLAFFSTANKGEPVPQAFTEEVVRERLFRGTISPEVDVRIEPLTAEKIWWDSSPDATQFVDWLRAQPGMHGFAFVSIGLSEDCGGACHPRLAVALTDQGSVVGVCGYVIWA